nr:PREDICTED: sarcalumenin [Bemisia tabaci]
MSVPGYSWICVSVILIIGFHQGNGLDWQSQTPSSAASTKAPGLSWGSHAPSETECRPYIERALKDLEAPHDPSVSVEETRNVQNDSNENADSQEGGTGEISSSEAETHPVVDETVAESLENSLGAESTESAESEPALAPAELPTTEDHSETVTSDEHTEAEIVSQEEASQAESTESVENTAENLQSTETIEVEDKESTSVETETVLESSETETETKIAESQEAVASEVTASSENQEESTETAEKAESTEVAPESEEVVSNPVESTETEEASVEVPVEVVTVPEALPESQESSGEVVTEPEIGKSEETNSLETESSEETKQVEPESIEVKHDAQSAEVSTEAPPSAPTESKESTEESAELTSKNTESTEESTEAPEEEELTMDIEIPKNLRPRDHIAQILKLDSESNETEVALSKVADNTLKELKRLYDTAIKPLELLYKYRDLSNRHFGDPEIFSKPLVLFMGPWSGGKSSMINYLLDNEFKKTALRTGAEPSPAYFNILMWGEEEAVLDGTQLAADWTFSGLQKFGQGLLDRLRGLRLRKPLLEKVNIVEIPGILEVRKQVERMFPFNDACQWFIDRADIIFLIYDPSKLDVGPETEAILDQLKGREYQTRIILNKADQVKPEELMRVQGTLIWNISPLMSSPEPPIMYSTSLWSLPYEAGTPTRLLFAQERAFLQDLRLAIEKRVENKIASARRFAVRVRNHAKMVDCYLTTYYNHKSFFGNRKKIAEDIIEHPQNYHIYEGLSTLTNISRYDLPDPEVYRDFFRLNPVYEFQRLSDTCTYFRGCPINRLDVAIAYDLPELVGRYKKAVDSVLAQTAKKPKS